MTDNMKTITDEDFIKLLKDNGFECTEISGTEIEININAKNKDGKTPLRLAIEKGNTEIAVELINNPNIDLTVKSEEKQHTYIWYAARYGNKDILESLLEKDKSYIDTPDEDNDTPLHIASSEGNTKAVELLLNNGADINIKNNKNETPLELAKDKEQIKGLFKQHTIEITDATFIQSLKGNGFIKDSDIKDNKVKININAKNEYGNILLHITATYGSVEVVERLIEKGVDINTKNENDDTPLHLAAKNGHKDIVELLINKGTVVDVKNDTNRTPLHIAAEKGRTEIVELLIDKGANKDAKSSSGLTPLHLAVENSHIEIVQSLIAKGANKDIKYLGKTPLELAQNLLKRENEKIEDKKDNLIANLGSIISLLEEKKAEKEEKIKDEDEKDIKYSSSNEDDSESENEEDTKEKQELKEQIKKLKEENEELKTLREAQDKKIKNLEEQINEQKKESEKLQKNIETNKTETDEQINELKKQIEEQKQFQPHNNNSFNDSDDDSSYSDDDSSCSDKPDNANNYNYNQNSQQSTITALASKKTKLDEQAKRIAEHQKRMNELKSIKNNFPTNIGERKLLLKDNILNSNIFNPCEKFVKDADRKWYNIDSAVINDDSLTAAFNMLNNITKAYDIDNIKNLGFREKKFVHFAKILSSMIGNDNARVFIQNALNPKSRSREVLENMIKLFNKIDFEKGDLINKSALIDSVVITFGDKVSDKTIQKIKYKTLKNTFDGIAGKENHILDEGKPHAKDTRANISFADIKNIDLVKNFYIKMKINSLIQLKIWKLI